MQMYQTIRDARIYN